MMRDEFYTEHPAHKDILFTDELYETGSVMIIGLFFIMVLALIISLLMDYERD